MFWLAVYLLLRSSRWIWWPGQRYRPPSAAFWVLLFVMGMAYRPGHPYSGLIAGAECIVLAGLLAYGRALRATQPTKETR